MCFGRGGGGTAGDAWWHRHARVKYNCDRAAWLAAPEGQAPATEDGKSKSEYKFQQAGRAHVFIANLLKPHFSKPKSAQLPALTGPSPALPAGSEARSSFASGPACVV